MSGTMILPDSPLAATFEQVGGWVGRDGRFYGSDERTARWAGSTHTKCSRCGAINEKHYTYCPACSEEMSIAAYQEMQKAPWDGYQMLYSEAKDRYFIDPQAAEDSLDEDDGRTLESLRLVLCEPNMAREIDPDYWCDDMAEDEEIPSELEDALNMLNAVIRALPPLSWSPGKFALDLSKE